MSRHPHAPPARRPPLPFAVGDETAEGVVFYSGGRWMVVGTDELHHELYERLRDAAPPRTVERFIGPALVGLLLN